MIPVFNIAKIRNSLPKNHVERMRSFISAETVKVEKVESSDSAQFTVDMKLYVDTEDDETVCNYEVGRLMGMILLPAEIPMKSVVYECFNDSGGPVDYKLHFTWSEVVKFMKTLKSLGFKHIKDEYEREDIEGRKYKGQVNFPDESILQTTQPGKNYPAGLPGGYFASDFYISAKTWKGQSTDIFKEFNSEYHSCKFSLSVAIYLS